MRGVAASVGLFLVGGFAALGGSARADSESACPPRLEAWRFYGNPEPGGVWTAQTLHIREAVGVLRDVLIRYRVDSVPAEHTRWFQVEARPMPLTVEARTIGFAGDELQAYCGGLSDERIDDLRHRSRPRCLVDPQGRRMTIRTTRGMVTVTDAGPGPAPPVPIGVGVAVGDAGIDESTLECEPVDKLEVTTEMVQPDDAGSDVVDLVDGMMGRMAALEARLDSGIAAIPTVRFVLALLSERDGERMPDGLPSTFALEAAVGPDAFVEALAVEHMVAADGADEQPALERLGELGVSEATARTLQLKLQEGRVAGDGRVVALTLRALLVSDPGIARFEATPLLVEPAFARAALGVFALTDEDVARELESLDANDADAVLSAGNRLHSRLELAETD